MINLNENANSRAENAQLVEPATAATFSRFEPGHITYFFQNIGISAYCQWLESL